MSYWNETFLERLRSDTEKQKILKLKIQNERGRVYYYFKSSPQNKGVNVKVLFFLD